VATLQTTHIFKINFPEIVDIALPAEGVFHNLVFVSIRKTSRCRPPKS
jgi:UbiD family decarboxylase